MTDLEFKESCKLAGFSYPKAAEFLGSSTAKVKMWALGRTKVPEEISEKLLGFLENEGIELPEFPQDEKRLRIQNLEEENLRLRAKVAQAVESLNEFLRHNPVHQHGDGGKRPPTALNEFLRGERPKTSIGPEGFFGTLGKKEGE